MALGVGLNGVVGFVTDLFPQQTLGWKQIAVALTGYANASAAKDNYINDREAMLISDVGRLKDQGKDGNVKMMVRSHYVRNVFVQLGFNEDETYRIGTRVLLVAGRIAGCIHHTKRLLRAKYQKENARRLRQPYHLQRTYPWLNRVFDPTIMRTVNSWCEAMGDFVDALSDDSDQLFEQYQLGTRYYALWRALDFNDEEEDRVAESFALYNCCIGLQEGIPFLKRVLKALQPRYPALNGISNDAITEIATTALESAGINQVEKE